jgi:hypothetical protein
MTVIVTNSKQQVNLNDTSIVALPVGDLAAFGLAATQNSAIVAVTLPIAPGAQATVLPSWVPTATDYVALVSDGVISQITEANSVNLSVGATSENVQLFTSGTPTTCVVSNPGVFGVWVALGSSSVAATVGSGTYVAPGAAVSLTLASATYLAAIAAAGSTVLVIAVGS